MQLRGTCAEAMVEAGPGGSYGHVLKLKPITRFTEVLWGYKVVVCDLSSWQETSVCD